MIRIKQIAAIVAASLVTAGAAIAGQVRFNPSIELQAGTSDNVEYVGTEETSDTTMTLAAELPIERSWSGGSFSMSYRPSYVAHADVDALDRAEHRLGLRSGTTIGRLTELSAAIGWHRRQEQGGTRFDEADPFEDRDPFLTERSDRESAWASLSLSKSESPRWRWNGGIGWATTDHDRIDDLANDPFDPTDPNRVEDRDEMGGSFGISRVVSRRTAVGVEVEHRAYELELTGDEQASLAGVTVTHDASRRLSLAVSLGMARQSFDDVARDDDDGVQGTFSLSRSFRTVALGLSASHRPGSGGHLTGSSTNTRGTLTLGNVGERPWGWNAALRFDRRNPTDPAADSRDALSLGVGTERSFGPSLGLTLGVGWLDQASDASGDRSAAHAHAGLRWYPRGRVVRAREGSS